MSVIFHRAVLKLMLTNIYSFFIDFHLKKKFIGVQLIYNVVLVSGV